MDEIEIFDVPLMEPAGLLDLLCRFGFSTLCVWVIIHLLYYPKSRRREYYFTFMLISVSIFFLIYLLGSVKIKIGFALGLFAIFGIIRYRTETMSVRDMTYLFVIIAMSVINALSTSLAVMEIITVNAIFILAIAIGEAAPGAKNLSQKLVLYDRVDLITPEHREELIADLEKRIGVRIEKVEIGGIDFLRDSVMIKIFYASKHEKSNSTNHILKFPKDSL